MVPDSWLTSEDVMINLDALSPLMRFQAIIIRAERRASYDEPAL